MNANFYKEKRVFITGHTGFKGSWLCKTLINMGAIVGGYSLPLNDSNILYKALNLHQYVKSYYDDIRNFSSLEKAIYDFKPEIVIHMAAQPLVIESYNNPVYTYDVNVMGTVNILECVRKADFVSSFLNVTTDKVYLNKEWSWGYRENEELCGYDPYSNSKSCSELVTSSFINSFFYKDGAKSISSSRAGNVIGGGDFSENRIIPDCIRSAENANAINVRNPNSIRPYQHVLEPISAYLTIVQMQYNNKKYMGAYNVGPLETDCVNTAKLVTIFCDAWKEVYGKEIFWETTVNEGPHEAQFLKLDCSKIKTVLNWSPTWSLREALLRTVEWTYAFKNESVVECTNGQISKYFNL